ncbi:MAG: glycoside hydrolase [Phycisphaerae bacterium]
MHRERVWFIAIALATGLAASAAMPQASEAARPRRGQEKPEKEEEIPEIDPALLGEDEDEIKRHTCVSIKEQAFFINEHPTHRGRVLKRGQGEKAEEHKIEGLLFSFRAVNAIFDDLNPETRSRWAYPDGPWDPERNTRAFIDALPYWHRSGCCAFTVNLQGGSPEGGIRRAQPWQNSAYTREGRLRADYMDRLAQILEYADQHRWVVILGLFSPGQDQHVWDERSVLRGVDAAVDWLLERKYTNVLVEVSSACSDRQYDHDILAEDRVDELVERVQQRSQDKVDSPAGRLLAGASMSGGVLPPRRLLRVSDFALLHGRTVDDPGRIRRLVEYTRDRMADPKKPILFNQDDHYDFESDENNLTAAALAYAGWGFHDYRRPGEGFHQGLDTPPVDWHPNSLRKYRFLQLLAKIVRDRPPYRSREVREALEREKKEQKQSRARGPVFSATCSSAGTEAAAQPGAVLTAGRARFAVDPATGACTLTGPVGDVWRSRPGARRFGSVRVEAGGKVHDAALGRCDVKKNATAVELTFHPLADDRDFEVRVTVSAEADETFALEWTASDAGRVRRLRLLDALWVTDAETGGVAVPVREGLLIPADTGPDFRHRFDTYAYEGCHMAMVGVVKAGAAALVTWDDPYVAVDVARQPGKGALQGRRVLGCSFDLRKTARGLRVRLLGKGGAVAIAKAYRAEAKRDGWFVPWETKLEENPQRRRYFGAVNYKLWSMLTRRMNEASTREESVRVNWTFDEAARVAEHLKRDLRLDRVLFIMGGWIRRGYDNQHPDILPAAPECGGSDAFAGACKRIRDLGYILSLHDNYQDMYRDAPSWDESYLMRRPDGSLAKGGRWAGGRAYLTCSKRALDLARRPQNLPAVRDLTGADSYFIDTTFAAGLQECFAEDHPLTRADDMHWKQALCDYARGLFGSFGSECGREWGIPHADFFEGITGVSGGYYHNKGLLGKLGAVPVPLFEIVYRPCIQAYGKYGYDINRAARYVLHHVRIGRPMHHHNIPRGLYWKEESGKAAPVPVHPRAAEVEPLGGRRFRITYHWQVDGGIAKDWYIFVHFTDRGGDIQFQDDHGADPPMTEWPRGDLADGPHTVSVPKGREGTFDVRVGFYARRSLGRVSLIGEGDGEQRYTVGRLTVQGGAVTFEPLEPARREPRGDPALFTRAGGGWADGMHPLDVFVKNTYEVLSPLNELTARLPMEDHAFLTEDRTVIRSVFGTGPDAVVTVVNMGEAPYRLRSRVGGEVVLPPHGFLVRAPTFTAFHASAYGGLVYEDPPLVTLRSLDGKPLGESAKVRLWHGFGDPRVRFRGKEWRVAREEIVAP